MSPRSSWWFKDLYYNRKCLVGSIVFKFLECRLLQEPLFEIRKQQEHKPQNKGSPNMLLVAVSLKRNWCLNVYLYKKLKEYALSQL